MFCKPDEYYIITYTIHDYVMFLRYMDPHTQAITKFRIWFASAPNIRMHMNNYSNYNYIHERNLMKVKNMTWLKNNIKFREGWNYIDNIHIAI